jgi:hypothetical protein
LSSKKRQPAVSSSWLILILAVASLPNDNAHPRHNSVVIRYSKHDNAQLLIDAAN